MFLVNNFGRVIEIVNEAEAKARIESGRLREATSSEIAAHMAHKSADPDDIGGVYYQTVRHTPDGYGMSRDHLKRCLFDQDIKLVENYNGQKVGLLYNYPNSIFTLNTDVRLIYTMFESDKIPDDWPDYLNAADEVIVPSKWCHDVFLKAGVETTIVPLGYNDEVFRYIDRDVSIRPQNDTFTFIHYNSFNLRKGFMEVFNAFTQEFSKKDNVKLILKTVHRTTPLPIIKSEYPNIEVVTGELSEKDLVDLLGRSDCMVYPSRGEGFGITPLEAMATGLPAIVPKAHGISEYFNSRYMLQVKADERCPALYKRFKGTNTGDMVVCDVDDLRQQMRYAYEHQAEMREIGRSASYYVQNWTYKHTAERLAAIIRKWQAMDVIKRKDSKYLQVEAV